MNWSRSILRSLWCCTHAPSFKRHVWLKSPHSNNILVNQSTVEPSYFPMWLIPCSMQGCQESLAKFRQHFSKQLTPKDKPCQMTKIFLECNVVILWCQHSESWNMDCDRDTTVICLLVKLYCHEVIVGHLDVSARAVMHCFQKLSSTGKEHDMYFPTLTFWVIEMWTIFLSILH